MTLLSTHALQSDQTTVPLSPKASVEHHPWQRIRRMTSCSRCSNGTALEVMSESQQANNNHLVGITTHPLNRVVRRCHATGQIVGLITGGLIGALIGGGTGIAAQCSKNNSLSVLAWVGLGGSFGGAMGEKIGSSVGGAFAYMLTIGVSILLALPGKLDTRTNDNEEGWVKVGHTKEGLTTDII